MNIQLLKENSSILHLHQQYLLVVFHHIVILCHIVVNIFTPFNRNIDDTTSSCINKIASKDATFKPQFCGIKLSTLDWNDTKYLKVYGFSDVFTINKAGQHIFSFQQRLLLHSMIFGKTFKFQI